MKDQYFADINDFRKYGMLRLLAAESRLSLGVCWMLTPPDDRTDGRFTQFWSDPERWRRYDPPLFDALCRCASTNVSRRVALAREWDILPGATYFEEVVPDDVRGRQGFFDRGWRALAGCDLVFLDPDNGLQVPSVPRGRRNSSKYVYWSEVETGFGRGHSLVIYQHFQRKPREAFADGLARELYARTGALAAYSFSTSHVLFLLAAQPAHAARLRLAVDSVRSAWADQVRLRPHVVA